LLEQNEELGKALYEMWQGSEGMTTTTTTAKTTATTTATTTQKSAFKIDDSDFEWFESSEKTPTTRRVRDFADPGGHVSFYRIFKKDIFFNIFKN
jgi:hypothetical protein